MIRSLGNRIFQPCEGLLPLLELRLLLLDRLREQLVLEALPRDGEVDEGHAEGHLGDLYTASGCKLHRAPSRLYRRPDR